MEQLLQSYAEVLDEVQVKFEEIGYNESERKTLLEGLTSRLMREFHAFAEEQEEVRNELKAQIEQYQRDIRSLSAALGRPAPAVRVSSNVTLKQQAKQVGAALDALHAEKAKAVEELSELQLQLQELWDQLGSPRNPEDFGEEINEFDPHSEFAAVDENRLDPATFRRYREQLEYWSVEKERRRKVMEEYGEMVASLEEELCEKGSLAFNPTSFSFLRINALRNRVSELQRMREERSVKLQQYRVQIEALWKLLEVPTAEQFSFKSGKGSLASKVLSDAGEEFSRLNKMKTAKMIELVDRAKDNLREVYAVLGMGEGRLGSICADKDVDEELLNAIEEETRQMREIIDSAQSIIALIPEREQLREWYFKLQERKSDPSRFLARSKKEAGGWSLLEEQRIDRRVNSKLPPLEKHLLRSMEKWEKQYGRQFIWQGERYIDAIVRDQQEDQVRVEERKMRLRQRSASRKAQMEESYIYGRTPDAHTNQSRLNMTSAAAPSVSQRAPRAVRSRQVQVGNTTISTKTSSKARAGTRSARATKKSRSKTISTPRNVPTITAMTPTNIPSATSKPRAVTISRIPHTRPAISTRSNDAENTTPIASVPRKTRTASKKNTRVPRVATIAAQKPTKEKHATYDDTASSKPKYRKPARYRNVKSKVAASWNSGDSTPLSSANGRAK